MALALQPGEVHVWRADLDGAGLSGSRRERRLAASRALRRLLAAYLEMRPEEVRLRRGAHGKPSLASEMDSEILFNLSHSGSAGLIAVTRGREVGIDVEELRPRRNLARLAERALDAEVAAAVRAAPSADREAVFYAAWTRHEATVKCHGAGLGVKSSSRPVFVRNIEIDDGYAAAMAWDAARAPILRHFAIAG